MEKHKLTPLQKLGISYLLIDLVNHGAITLKKGGTLKVVNDSLSIDGYNGSVYIYKIDEHENADDTEYSFQWDGTEKLFHIIEITRKEYTAWLQF